MEIISKSEINALKNNLAEARAENKSLKEELKQTKLERESLKVEKINLEKDIKKLKRRLEKNDNDGHERV